MIDFDKGVQKLSGYGGSEAKTAVLYGGAMYMVKYPDPVREKNNQLSYMNNQYSEYIGCHIANACGIKAQETVLGYMTSVGGIRKIVVGCKDFTEDEGVLYEFSRIAKQTKEGKREELTIEYVKEVVEAHPLITDKDEVMCGFWDMYVIDALIGNKDRHLDNWGLVENGGKLRFAPIYDCGSSLAALMSDDKMRNVMQDMTEFRNCEYNVYSCYKYGGKKMFYHEIFRNPSCELGAAIKRVVPRVDMNAIGELIGKTEEIAETRKEYLKRAVNMRYEEILLSALKRQNRQGNGDDGGQGSRGLLKRR